MNSKVLYCGKYTVRSLGYPVRTLSRTVGSLRISPLDEVSTKPAALFNDSFATGLLKLPHREQGKDSFCPKGSCRSVTFVSGLQLLQGTSSAVVVIMAWISIRN